MDVSKLIDEGLDGSPYLFHDDAPDSGRARRFLAEYEEVKGRVRSAQAALEMAATDAREHLARTFGVRLVYESNQLERLGPDLRTTTRVIDRLRRPYDAPSALEDVVRGEPKLMAVVGLHRAHEFATELADELSRPMTEADIRALHAMIVPDEEFAGKYKDRNVEIDGTDHVPTDVLDTAREMYELAIWLRATAAPAPLVAAVVHAWTTHIHPFRDGNGRLARLLANYALLRDGWPPLVIRSSLDRGQYLDALGESDRGGDIMPLAALFLGALRRSAEDLINPERVIGAFQEDLLATYEDSYNTWSVLHHELESRLSVRLAQRGFDLDVKGELAPSDFSRLAARDNSGNGWYALVRERTGNRELLLWFGHYSEELHQQAEGRHRFPTLLFSERDRSAEAVHPYRPLLGTGRFSLDEVALSPSLMHDPLLIRSGRNVRRLSMDDGAEMMVEAFSSWQP
jgi:Fic family protein